MDKDFRMSEIVGGLSISDVAKGGAVFEVKHEAPDEDESTVPPEYMELIQGFTKLECLDFGNQYDGEEPFSNLAKKMTDLVEDGKVKKRIMRTGYGLAPDENSNVNIHYNAYVQYEAHPFDSTYARKKPFSCVLGDGQLIKGLEIGLRTMLVNEKSQFLIASELAYRRGGLRRIPPNATVLFEVELCSVMQPPTKSILDSNEKDFAHVYPFCLAQSVKGKRMFRLKDYQGAIKEYRIAVRKLEEVFLNDYDEQLKSEELLVRLYSNLLICCTHVADYKKGCIFAQRVYDMAKNKTFEISSKVHYNHTKCLRMLGEYQRAERKLNEAKRLEPHNPEILQEFLAIRKAAAKAAEDRKKRETTLGKALVNSH